MHIKLSSILFVVYTHYPSMFFHAELPPVGPIELGDIELALKNTRPSAHLHAHRYEEFNEDYGSHLMQ